MMRAIFIAWAIVAVATGAAVAQVPPFTIPVTLGTTSTPILIANPQRKKLIFHNPNATAKVAVCPVGPNRAPGGGTSAIVAVINGPGCITILPYDRVEIPGVSPGTAGLPMPSAWVGIASAAASALTILEFE